MSESELYTDDDGYVSSSNEYSDLEMCVEEIEDYYQRLPHLFTVFYWWEINKDRYENNTRGFYDWNSTWDLIVDDCTEMVDQNFSCISQLYPKKWSNRTFDESELRDILWYVEKQIRSSHSFTGTDVGSLFWYYIQHLTGGKILYPLRMSDKIIHTCFDFIYLHTCSCTRPSCICKIATVEDAIALYRYSRNLPQDQVFNNNMNYSDEELEKDGIFPITMQYYVANHDKLHYIKLWDLWEMQGKDYNSLAQWLPSEMIEDIVVFMQKYKPPKTFDAPIEEDHIYYLDDVDDAW